jgi:NAD(P)-dependent dehydrogenase (short-subunit alcohol dehydrogenase family)
VGGLEDASMEEIKSQFETNLFGLRTNKSNTGSSSNNEKEFWRIVVNISSVAGRFGYPIMSAYISSEFALEGLSEDMAYEVEPFGIKVVIIEPGFIRTNFQAVTAKKGIDSSSPYLSTMQKAGNYFNSMMEQASSQEQGSKVILQAVTTDNPQLRYTVGEDAAKAIQAKMIMPYNEFKKIVMQNFSI